MSHKWLRISKVQLSRHNAIRMLVDLHGRLREGRAVVTRVNGRYQVWRTWTVDDMAYAGRLASKPHFAGGSEHYGLLAEDSLPDGAEIIASCRPYGAHRGLDAQAA